MKTIFKIVIVGLGTAALFSCEKEAPITSENSLETNTNLSNREQVNLGKLGFDIKNTEKKTISFPDNTTQEYYVNADQLYPVATLDDLDDIRPFTKVDAEAELDSKLFRSFNLAAGNRTYTVAFFDVNQEYQRQAIGDFIWAFNTILDTSIQLRAVFAPQSAFSSTSRDIAIFFEDLGPRSVLGLTLALAEFPSQNLPGKNISVNSNSEATPNYNTRANFRSLLMHEVGHLFGLRHSDLTGILEGEIDSGIGARNIPGTDNTGLSRDSIMFSGFVGGRWYTNQDIVAMRYLYGHVPR
ncbi:M57 family metalloprotease [Aquimarina agarilytica]|uniref:M57 family metalloprotease n=1 Tax=Aquimarina agarilytica TaxID=1087449 RepID=UPI0002881AAB|nr:M57 family metalloprotease [Aquimarina agarilytica]